jgi:hypothetical protein
MAILIFIIVWIVSFLIQAKVYSYIVQHSPAFSNRLLKLLLVVGLNVITNLILINCFNMWSLFFVTGIFRKASQPK